MDLQSHSIFADNTLDPRYVNGSHGRNKKCKRISVFNKPNSDLHVFSKILFLISEPEKNPVPETGAEIVNAENPAPVRE
jgi:hypothetical protein